MAQSKKRAPKRVAAPPATRSKYPLAAAGTIALLLGVSFVSSAPAPAEEGVGAASRVTSQEAPSDTPLAAPEGGEAIAHTTSQSAASVPATEDSGTPHPQESKAPEPLAPTPHPTPTAEPSSALTPAQVHVQAEALTPAEAPVHASPLCTNLPRGDAWAGVGTACRTMDQPAPTAAPTAAPTPGPPTSAQYAQLVQDIVTPWCGQVRVLVDDPSVVSGDVYGMSWWGTNDVAIRSGIPMAITKDMALHECGHILQARVFPGKSTAISRFNVIHGTAGTDGLEQNARCISAYLSPHALPAGVGAGPMAARWSNQCSGAMGDAAIKVIQGIRP